MLGLSELKTGDAVQVGLGLHVMLAALVLERIQIVDQFVEIAAGVHASAAQH